MFLRILANKLLNRSFYKERVSLNESVKGARLTSFLARKLVKIRAGSSHLSK